MVLGLHLFKQIHWLSRPVFVRQSFWDRAVSRISESRDSPFSHKVRNSWFDRLHEMMLSTEGGRPKMDDC
jgi:hypothetical protein